MLHLQRHLPFAAVGTLSLPLLQQIVAQFIAHQAALLIGDSLDLWLLHRLCIELDQFQADRAYGAELYQPRDPGEDVEDPAL